MDAASFMKQQLDRSREENRPAAPQLATQPVAIQIALTKVAPSRGEKSDCHSETTVYDNAVRNEISLNKQYLSSSLEGEGLGLDTSDESTGDLAVVARQVQNVNLNESFLAGIDQSGG